MASVNGVRAGDEKYRKALRSPHKQSCNGASSDVAYWHFLAVLVVRQLRQLSEGMLPSPTRSQSVDHDSNRTFVSDRPKGIVVLFWKLRDILPCFRRGVPGLAGEWQAELFGKPVAIGGRRIDPSVALHGQSNGAN